MSFGLSISQIVSQSDNPLLQKASWWERVELLCVAHILNGAPWKSSHFNLEKGVPLIRIRDVTTGQTDTRYAGPVDDGYWVEDGDFLVGMDGDFNCREWYGGRGLLNQRVCKITPNSKYFLQRFLRYVLPGYLQTINDETHSITVKHLSSKTLGEVPLPLPPFAEQRRIVAKLDSLTARTARARSELDHITRLVEKYKEAILAKAFSGELTREWRGLLGFKHKPKTVLVKDIAKVETGSTPPTKDREKYFGGDVPFFKPTDLDAGYQVVHPRETLTDAGAKVARVVPAGSTLVTCIGATIAKTGFARVECCTNQQINALIPDRQKVQPEWLFWMVVSPAFRQSILDNSSATTLPIINKGRFELLELSVPPLAEQQEIVRRIEAAFAWLNKVAAEHARASHLVPKLDQSILAKAFRGELVPQDPNDKPASALLERIKAASGEPKTTRGGRGKRKGS